MVLVQMSMGDYRDAFVKTLLETVKEEYESVFFIGDHYFGKTTRTSDYIKKLPIRRRAINLMVGSAMGWQVFDYRKAVFADITVLELNPRLVHTWLILLLRKLLGKPTVLWGHVWARSGPDTRTESLRAVMRNLADRLLFYTDEQRREQLQKLGPRSENRASQLFVAANSLYNRKDIFAESAAGRSFIYVGRLVPEKKPVILVRAFLEAAPRMPEQVLQHMVGAGPESEEIANLVRASSDGHRVVQHGHIGDYATLRALYGASLFSVSPGYVGLSAIQSLSYGRPILVSRDEPHAPELTALVEGKNAVFFDTDNQTRLAQTLVDLVEHAPEWEARFDGIAQECAQSYSIETMVDGYVKAISP